MAKTTHKFLGRAGELKLFEDLFSQSRSSLVVVHGRRRVGKSSLIGKFVQGKSCLIFEGLESQQTPSQIENFLETLRAQVNLPVLDSFKPENWIQVLQFLTDHVIPRYQEKLVICFDELPWMAAGRKQLVSIIKNFWDNKWKNQNVFLILCGSISTFMIEKVVRSKALYGRISIELCLQPMSPRESVLLFSGKRNVQEISKYFLLFGGVPKYLEDIDTRKSFQQNIDRLCFSSTGPMVSEFEKVFYSQFKEYRIYAKICELLSNSPRTHTDLATRLKLASGGGLSRYLENLEQAAIIRKIEAQEFDNSIVQRSNKYYLTDEYMNFYFSFIRPNLKVINELRMGGGFERFTKNRLEPWLGYAFERLCNRYALYLAGKLGFADQVLDFGPYIIRHAKSIQIDLLFRRADKVITICEVKYLDSPISTSVIAQVERITSALKIPRGFSLEKCLICAPEPSRALRESQYFDQILSLGEIFS